MQTNSSSSGGYSWLFAICCILCCGGCCFGAAKYAETHGHEFNNHDADYHHHHHSPCPNENDHRREMQDMMDPYGNPIMAGPNLHGYNPPAHHMHGQAYVPPPPLVQSPYNYGPSAGFDSHNHHVSSGYNPAPMANYNYSDHNDSSYPQQHRPTDQRRPQGDGNALPPGFMSSTTPYSNANNQPGIKLEKISDSQQQDNKGFSYPSQIEQSPKKPDISKTQYESALVQPKKEEIAENEKGSAEKDKQSKVTQSEILTKTEK
jgi:hypothetical protein